MTKEQLYDNGVRTDKELGNNYFVCTKCSHEWRSKKWTDGKCSQCGDNKPEYFYVEYIEDYIHPPVEKKQKQIEICYDDTILRQARTEAKAKKGNLWVHVYQCPNCRKTHIQHNCDGSIPCTCGGTLEIRYTYDHKRIEYYARGGEPVGKQVDPSNFIKQLRKEMGITQQELAKELGITQQFLSKVEQGDRPVTPNIANWIDKMS